MPSATRRRLLVAAAGLFTLSGCSGNRPTATTEATPPSQTTHRPQTRKPGWFGLEVENNDDVRRTVTVVVELGGERQFDRTLTLRPQSEPEFQSVFRMPDSETSQVRVETDPEDGGSTSYEFTLAPDDDTPRAYVTVDENGVVTGRHEPAEPIPTTDAE